MKRLIAATLLMLLPPMAGAQDFPELFDVTGVASDDVLNVRENPRASAPIIGTFAHDATGIEVIETSESGNWGRVNLGEGSGWSSMRFLAQQPFRGVLRFEAPLRCFGTEPFWDVTLDGGDTAVLRFLGEEDGTFTITRKLPSHNTGPAAQLFEADGPDDASLIGVVSHNHCSDGMSDAVWGMQLEMYSRAGDVRRLYSGCCSLDVPTDE